MGLAHVVVTSVDRDDLDDGGAGHFAAVIRAIRERSPETTIEVLTPDFLRKDGALEIVVEARPDVFNHNLETVPSLYLTVRPGARYFHSIRLLQRVKELDPQMFTKSGIMVGLGEERNEVLQLMDDLRTADVDFLTIGQYLQPTPKHHAVKEFVTPEAFKSYETIAYTKGFLLVSATPAHALVASCRRGFRTAQGCPRRPRLIRKEGRGLDAGIPDDPPRRAFRRGDVRPRRRRRALSGIRAVLRAADGARTQERGRARGARRRHGDRLQARARDLHLEGDARPRGA